MLDLDAYLRRIGHVGARAPTLELLTAVCAAHPARIAFENIDPLLGRAPDLAPEALQAKLVGRRRGGYCYEQNTLLRLALLALGMQVTALAARVVWMSPPGAPARPRSHMLLKVELPDAAHESYVVDAGFGGHLLGTPLRLQPGLVQRAPGGSERISADDAGSFAVEAQTAQGWSALYRFGLEAQLPVDFAPLNWYTATHPASIFRHNLLLERLTPQRRAALLNDRLTLSEPGVPARTLRIATAAEFGAMLDEVFDLEAPVAAAELFERIPKGLDGAFLPGPDQVRHKA